MRQTPGVHHLLFIYVIIHFQYPYIAFSELLSSTHHVTGIYQLDYIAHLVSFSEIKGLHLFQSYLAHFPITFFSEIVSYVSTVCIPFWGPVN